MWGCAGAHTGFAGDVSSCDWSEQSSAGIDHSEEMELLLENCYRLAEDLSNAARELRALIDDSQSVIFLNLDRWAHRGAVGFCVGRSRQVSRQAGKSTLRPSPLRGRVSSTVWAQPPCRQCPCCVSWARDLTVVSPATATS